MNEQKSPRCVSYCMGRFKEHRNARIVAAYEERLAVVEGDAVQRRMLGISGVVTARIAAKQMRDQQQNAATRDSTYFRRQKVIIGLFVCRLVNVTSSSAIVERPR